MANIIIIDDDLMTCELLSEMISSVGHNPSHAQTLRDGLEKVEAGSYDLVFLDVNLPDGDGLRSISRIREAPASPQVIIITGQGDPDGAELAIRSGAWDYIEKNTSLGYLKLALARALQYREAKAGQQPVSLDRKGIVGSSQAIKTALDTVAQAAGTDANVLITGETGSGKECFAWAIHANSSRAGNRFVVVDCTALPETLVESILFGHEKGAFTGAAQSKEGLIQQAHGGTLFLDEIGELPLNIQKSFLRVLEVRRYRPLGSSHELACDFRLLAATNRNLDQMVADGTFREDLLFRLRSLVLHVAPLRDRKEDILELALHHMNRLCEKFGCGIKGFSPELVEALNSYPWPGNVRELFNALESVFSAAIPDPMLYRIHLPTLIRVHLARRSINPIPAAEGQSAMAGFAGASSTNAPLTPFQQSREAHERKYLIELMERTNGNIAEACQISSLSRSHLYDLLKKHGLSKSDTK